uniref:hypothetical protein n=1 Tax=uncultured Draconibacterium sp. TaxID=1573823 RepID=UPI00321646B7
MKIRYTKRRLKHYLILGILWSALGIAAVSFNSENIFSYGYSIIGILYFGIYLFQNNKQYLTIENGIISKNDLISQKIYLNEIKQIKRRAGAYILLTDSTELRINTELIDKNSLEELKTVLESLNLETN